MLGTEPNVNLDCITQEKIYIVRVQEFFTIIYIGMFRPP